MISDQDILKAKVLIIDDIEDNVFLLKSMLNSAGYMSVKSATDSREGVDLYNLFRPDILLLDIVMPHLDGYQVIEKLKKIAPDNYLPIIVLTARKDKKTRLQALEAGARDFLNKPFDVAETLSRIRNLIEVRLLHKKLQEGKLLLENEHNEAEEIGKALLRQESIDRRLNVGLFLEPCSRTSGDRAGFVSEKNVKIEKNNDWLVMFDATGHGKGAAKFQEVAIGGLLATIKAGHPMGNALAIANLTLEDIGSGLFLVGNIWRVMHDEEKQVDEGWVWVEEFNIAQHYVMFCDFQENEVKEWEWSNCAGSGKVLPLGLFGNAFDELKPAHRKMKKGSRTITYTDGIIEAVNRKGEQFGKERLKGQIIKTRRLSPEIACFEITCEVKRWIGELPESANKDVVNSVQIEDDVTIVISDILNDYA